MVCFARINRYEDDSRGRGQTTVGYWIRRPRQEPHRPPQDNYRYTCSHKSSSIRCNVCHMFVHLIAFSPQYITNIDSLRNLLLRDGERRKRLRELMHPHRSRGGRPRSYRHLDYQIRTSTTYDDFRFYFLRDFSAYHSYSVHGPSQYRKLRKSSRWYECPLHSRVQLYGRTLCMVVWRRALLAASTLAHIWSSYRCWVLLCCKFFRVFILEPKLIIRSGLLVRLNVL